jgi:hypothetical protein
MHNISQTYTYEYMSTAAMFKDHDGKQKQQYN